MSKTLVSRLLKIAFTVAVVTVAAHYVHPEKIVSAMLAVHPVSLGCAVLLLIPNLYLQQLKWFLLLRRIDGAVSSITAWQSLLAGFPLGLATPGRWGELGRAIFLPAYPRATVAALAAVDKLLNFAAVAVLGAAGLITLWRYEPLAGLFVPPALIPAIIVFVLAATFLSPVILRKLLNRNQRAEQGPSWIGVLLDFERGFMLRLYMISFLFVLTFSTQLVILVGGLQAVEMTAGLAAAGSTFLAQSLLPLSIGDLGVREGAAAFFFGKIGVAAHAAFGAALLLFVINMLLPGATGLVILWKNPSKPRL